MLIAIFLGVVFFGLIVAAWFVHTQDESLCTQDCDQGRRCTCSKELEKQLEQRRKFEDECG